VLHLSVNRLRNLVLWVGTYLATPGLQISTMIDNTSVVPNMLLHVWLFDDEEVMTKEGWMKMIQAIGLAAEYSPNLA